MPVVRHLALALAATALAVGGGVALADVPQDTGKSTAEPSVPLTDFDTTELVAARAAFCDDLPETAVTEALDGEPVDEAAYGSGDRADLTPRVEDVAHEFGCSWQGEDGVVARAWLFVPPVTPARADSLVAAARKQRGCTPEAGAPAYGVPSLALVCTAGGERTQSYRGLFGDAWLTCELSAPTTVTPAALADRAGRWCVSVASAVEVTG
ncbi:hypothetical protein [Nocardioides sp. 503]|uniref:hypothetical protein n=1 Tax=Nocardioides sp. 503 TaxID=2508326 RepID=UPI00106FD5CF|nr:hypothetical protein [Nocardioides sp. 503]